MLFNECHIPLVRSGPKTTTRRPHPDPHLYDAESGLWYQVERSGRFSRKNTTDD